MQIGSGFHDPLLEDSFYHLEFDVYSNVNSGQMSQFREKISLSDKYTPLFWNLFFFTFSIFKIHWRF